MKDFITDKELYALADEFYRTTVMSIGTYEFEIDFLMSSFRDKEYRDNALMMNDENYELMLIEFAEWLKPRMRKFQIRYFLS